MTVCYAFIVNSGGFGFVFAGGFFIEHIEERHVAGGGIVGVWRVAWTADTKAPRADGGGAVDQPKNAAALGEQETRVDAGPVAVWVMPTNEELIVARQALEVLTPRAASGVKSKV